MTQKEAYIKKRKKQLDRFKGKFAALSKKVKAGKKGSQKGCSSLVKTLRSKFKTADRRLAKLSDSDVEHWEQRRKKLRDSLWEVRGMLDRLNIKAK